MATEQVLLRMSAFCAEKDAQFANMKAKIGELQRQVLVLKNQNLKLKQ